MSLSYRTYASPAGPFVTATQFLADTGVVLSDGSTGGFRPIFATDFYRYGNGPSSFATPSSEFIRPNDNVAYSVGDLMTNSTTATTFNVLTGAALGSGRGGFIQNLTLSKTGTNIANATFRVYFYSSSSATIGGQDNIPMTGLYANSPYLMGSVDFPTMTTGYGAGSVGRAQLQQVALAYTTVDGNLYWLQEAEAAYTPSALERFTLSANVLRD